MKTKAAVLRHMDLAKPYFESKPLQIETLELDPPCEDELLVRVLASGLCHSDLSVIDGSRPRPMPMVLGHEGIGEVMALGPGTKRFSVGDHVVFCFVPSCGFCEYCVVGRASLCEVGAKTNTSGELPNGGRRWHAEDGSDIHHHLGVSAFAEMTVISARSAVRIDKDIPVDVAAIFGCAVLTGVGAIVNTAKVSPGESVAIFGLGGIGLAALLGAKLAGAHPILAIDVQPHKLELAHQLGATHMFRSDISGELTAGIKSVTGGGVDYALETVGNEKVLQQAYHATRRGGTTVTVGLPHPQRMLSISAVSLVAEERTLKGSYMGSAVPIRDIPRYIALYKSGALPVDKLLTHRLDLDSINVGFDRLATGEAVRQVIIN
jgi:Zn-dependent alcohol dehydrogenase